MAKHEHRFQVISHLMDWKLVLVMCRLKPCTHTEVWEQGKVRIAPRKFRMETDEEWQTRRSSVPHICCAS